MRHRKSGRKLKRTASHRKALLGSLATSLLRHKRITTTVAKAKEARVVVEKIITRSKRAVAAGASADTSTKDGKFIGSAGPARREVGRLIKDRGVVSELFSTIAPKVASRPGGYTRITKLGRRQGDGAELAVLELVDFQIGDEPAAKEEKKKDEKPKKRSRKKDKEATKPEAEAAGKA
ncbi:MAG: 50S ribosomal protein L17 [Ignavibacteria bacterium]|nr:50S ribosomal protein L17 [Ignavibacteria bacterium]